MEENLFIEIINGLSRKTIDIPEVHAKCLGKPLTNGKAQQFLYEVGREVRFELFIALYDATLKSDLKTAFEVFKEAYCSSDNIFAQIRKSKLSFDLKVFLNYIKSEGLDIYGLMSEDERKYYDELPNRLKIYRGVSEAEHKSKNYGISWDLCPKEAENYIYFDKNKVEKGKGGLVSSEIDKSDVFTIFSVHGKCEIIYIAR